MLGGFEPTLKKKRYAQRVVVDRRAILGAWSENSKSEQSHSIVIATQVVVGQAIVTRHAQGIYNAKDLLKDYAQYYVVQMFYSKSVFI